MISRGQTRKNRCGVVTSGGTESILLAMKAYRDWGLDQKGITVPEMIVSATAHAAYDKAVRCFGIRLVRVSVDADFKADVTAVRKAVKITSPLIFSGRGPFPPSSFRSPGIMRRVRPGPRRALPR